MKKPSKLLQKGFLLNPYRFNTTPPISYYLRDQMNGASRDTAIFSTVTRSAPWVADSVLGGTDTQTGGLAIISPTVSGLFFEGRSTSSDNISIVNRECWIHVTDISTVRHKFIFGYAHRSNRNMNIRFELEVAFGAFVLVALWSNFGGGTPWSFDYESAGAVPPWWGFVDEGGTDIAWYTATDSSGAPGTRTLVRRLSVTSGGDGYFSPNDGDISALVDNYSSQASAITTNISEIYITA